MTINSIKITDGLLKFNEIFFEPLALLVGVSGAGKTKTFDVIRKLRKAALRSAVFASGCSWSVCFNIDDHKYCWEGQISSDEQKTMFVRNAMEDLQENNKNIHFSKEKITKDGSTLVTINHNDGIFIYKGKSLPKLKWTESAISLLGEEHDIIPLKQALQRIVTSESENSWVIGVNTDRNKLNRHRSIEDLKLSNDTPLLEQALFIQEKHNDLFNEIVSSYIHIFPFIKKIKIVNAKKYFPKQTERMPKPEGFSGSHAQWHNRHLNALFLEKNPACAYNKNNPKEVSKKYYFNELCKRIQKTPHLPTLKDLLDCWHKLGGTIPGYAS
ncbi:MAG: hypothetical protein HQM02_10630 [Magnetococcales bacterium]|nr:hypothetical protein [Magnetococcales bacterium]